MALLTVQALTGTGIVPTFAAVAASDTFAAAPRQYIELVNGNAGTVTLTVTNVATDQFGITGTALDLVTTIAAGARKKIPLGDNAPQRFNSPSTGVATVTCSPTSTVTIGVFQA
jgi:hypothetical protein